MSNKFWVKLLSLILVISLIGCSSSSTDGAAQQAKSIDAIKSGKPVGNAENAATILGELGNTGSDSQTQDSYEDDDSQVR